MKSQTDRIMAERLFVREGKSLEEIAAATAIGKATLARWSKDGEWVRKRAERNRESPQASIDKLKRQRELQITALGDGVASAEQIDALYKLNLMIEKMEASTGAIGPMLDTMGRFAEFVAANAQPEDCALLRDWIEKWFRKVRTDNA